MELAVNTFNKGLQMDTHPQILGLDTLTNALNATFVTMNGNEIILQNDMGNRRVDKAFLPAGYEPVGIKEYGGVIYVAAYNPITGNSLIGSFPSPERTYNNRDDLSKSINFGDLIKIEESTFSNKLQYNSNKEENYYFINKFSTIQIFDENLPLHIGDKFVLYSNNKDDNNKDEFDKFISKINNTKEGKIISPKNKLFTLLVGILNSQNNFVDLTGSLVRWKDGEIVSYEANTPQEYKENDGNFIKVTDSTSDETFTISDSLLIENRENFPCNYYLYKLSGPLCLKWEVNHFLDFSYTINVDSFFLPEEVLSLSSKRKKIYKSEMPSTVLDTDISVYKHLGITENNSKLQFDCFDLFQIIEDENNQPLGIKLLLDYVPGNVIITYDELTNLYTATVTRTYITQEKGLFKYIIAPKLLNNNGKASFKLEEIDASEITLVPDTSSYNITITATITYNSPDILSNSIYGNSKENPSVKINYNGGSIYLQDLCIKNEIDLSKVNTGILEIPSWRTYYSEKSINVFEGNTTSLTDALILQYTIVGYPYSYEEYRDLTLKIYNIGESKPFITKPLSESSFSLVDGSIKFEIGEGEGKLKKSLLYNVDLEYTICNKNNPEEKLTKKIDKYWIMTTKLFNNSFYMSNRLFFIRNYVEPTKDELKIRENLLTISNVDIKLNDIYDNNPDDLKIKVSRRGDIFFKEVSLDNPPYITITTEKTLTTNLKGTISINTDLYPTNMFVNNEVSKEEISLLDNVDSVSCSIPTYEENSEFIEYMGTIVNDNENKKLKFTIDETISGGATYILDEPLITPIVSFWEMASKLPCGITTVDNSPKVHTWYQQPPGIGVDIQHTVNLYLWGSSYSENTNINGDEFVNNYQKDPNVSPIITPGSEPHILVKSKLINEEAPLINFNDQVAQYSLLNLNYNPSSDYKPFTSKMFLLHTRVMGTSGYTKKALVFDESGEDEWTKMAKNWFRNNDSGYVFYGNSSQFNNNVTDMIYSLLFTPMKEDPAIIYNVFIRDVRVNIHKITTNILDLLKCEFTKLDVVPTENNANVDAVLNLKLTNINIKENFKPKTDLKISLKLSESTSFNTKVNVKNFVLTSTFVDILNMLGYNYDSKTLSSNRSGALTDVLVISYGGENHYCRFFKNTAEVFNYDKNIITDNNYIYYSYYGFKNNVVELINGSIDKDSKYLLIEYDKYLKKDYTSTRGQIKIEYDSVLNLLRMVAINGDNVAIGGRGIKATVPAYFLAGFANCNGLVLNYI